MNIPLTFFYIMSSEDFHYWIEQNAIPQDLLSPSRVSDLHQYLYNNRLPLFNLLKSRPEISRYTSLKR